MLLTYVNFFLNDSAPTEIYTLSLHDALPICAHATAARRPAGVEGSNLRQHGLDARAVSMRGGDSQAHIPGCARDRKSTRLNSSHGYISYAVFCLKKKKTCV